MADAAPTPPLRSRRPSPLAAALLGWLVPGLGHLYAGRGRKGLYFFAVIGATYVGGLLLADFRCVSWERDPFWFAAQSVAAGPTALVAWLTRDLPIDRRIPTFDVGLLYVSVASLLNAVAVADALGLVDERLIAAAAEDARAAEEAARLAAVPAAASAAGDPGLAPPFPAPLPGAPFPPAGQPPTEPPPPPAGEPPRLPRADLPDLGTSPP